MILKDYKLRHTFTCEIGFIVMYIGFVYLKELAPSNNHAKF